MARKSKLIKLDDREITIKELRVKDIAAIFTSLQTVNKDDFNGIIEKAKEFLPTCIDLDEEAFMELAPSELKDLYAAFKEVNEDFFGTLKSLGLDKVVEGIKSDMTKNFTVASVESSQEGTE